MYFLHTNHITLIALGPKEVHLASGNGQLVME